ncbi:MAG: PQQ-dependent sugar dehydrogenase [Phycisphaeraceae bacterium]
MKTFSAAAMTLTLTAALPAAAQDFFPTPIETGPLAVGIRDFATLPDSANGSSSGPARMSVMTADPLGRLYVNDQRGPIYNVSPTGDVTEYLDVRAFPGIDLRTESGEQGLQSFAFHPGFHTPGSAGFGKFYTIQSTSNTTPAPDFDPGGGTNFHTLVLEWSVADPTAATYSAGGGVAPRELMRIKQSLFNHNGGLAAFNTSVGPGHPDYGHLYLSFGDGGGAGDPQDNGQDTTLPHGTVLRIDPIDPDGAGPLRYTPVAGNTLAMDGDANTLAEIYAYGLRNPQRFGWDDATGDLFVADIGQNEVEEIDLVVNGGNYGWDAREGSFAFNGGLKTPGMIDPIFEYDHTNTAEDIPTSISRRAVTVGEVARGSGIQALDGNLLFGDFPTGMIFYADVDAGVPAEGSGQDPIAQLQLIDKAGNNVQLLDLINQARADRGLGAQTRTDLRFSIGTAGEIYILNKHDGVVRILTPVLDGDTDGDGDVDDTDLGTAFSNYTGPIGAAGGKAWADGDTDFDGDIDDTDLGTSFSNYTGPLGPVNVPEPSTAMGLMLGLLAVRRHRH